MSHPLSPTRNSIFGWVKNLKRGSLMSSDSVNEISDRDDVDAHESNLGAAALSNGSASDVGGSVAAAPAGPSVAAKPSSDFLRPSLLNHKSRSSNNVNRMRLNSLGQSEKSLRQHRDSFLQNNALVDENSKYFGVPLEVAINQSCAKISILTLDKDNVLQYGRIPIVVAKCAIFIKKNGLGVEGIFRVGGSSKRLKELQVIFNTPPDFGKKLNWDGYNVHDAASLLRRYLNALPEPLIPLDMYEDFRDPLRERPRIINYMKYKAENPKPLKPQLQPAATAGDSAAVPGTPIELLSSTAEPLTEANIDRLNLSTDPSVVTDRAATAVAPTASTAFPTNITISQPPAAVDPQTAAQGVQPTALDKQQKKAKNYKKLTKDVHEAMDIYKQQVERLPDLSKQLLFYILDLLAMVNTQLDENLMSSRNLAAIFQPSILSHPNHDLDPVEYALSQAVVEFLIRYAYKLLPNQKGEAPGSTVEPKTSESSTSPTPPQTIPAAVPLQPPTTVSPPTDSLMVPGQWHRQHSKSLSSAQPHDLLGYSPSSKQKQQQLDELEQEAHSMDFDITDDDELQQVQRSTTFEREAKELAPREGRPAAE